MTPLSRLQCMKSHISGNADYGRGGCGNIGRMRLERVSHLLGDLILNVSSTWNPSSPMEEYEKHN